MQGDAQKQVRNAALFAGLPPSRGVSGAGVPNKYKGKQHEYFESPTTAYIWQNAQYASNYFQARVQGIIPGTFEDERGAYIRSMDIVEQTTGAKMPNDYQSVYFQDTRIKGLYTGAKLTYAGNTWLAISPFNVADPLSSAVIRRCNAVWKHLDYYGNVKSEPFIFHDGRASATANEYLDWDVIPNWYQKCVMQLNDDTRELAYNRRIVLGSSVVEVRGLVDFISDFTGQNKEENEEPEPSHVMFFDVQFQQPIEADDMERGIAGAKNFSWVITVSGADRMQSGTSQKLTVASIRNNEEPDTDKHPVSYLYTSSDTSVLTVDQEGIVTGVGDGTAIVRVYLEQNQSIAGTMVIRVSAAAPNADMVFLPDMPEELKQFQTYNGLVKTVLGGANVASDIEMTAYGATENCEIHFDKTVGMLRITCYEASDVPLSLVFKDTLNNLTETRNIRLGGY